jgi:hypothetical protein
MFKTLTELFWFFFNKVRHFFNFGDVTKKVFIALFDVSRSGFENNCTTNFAK